MPQRVVALGGGHGLAALVRALREHSVDLTVVVTMADDGGSSGALRRQRQGPALGDMRRSLSAASQDVALARAFERPLAIHRLGRHPIGNLVLRSVAEGFGDLEAATAWLADQLGVRARVLPATCEPVALLAELSDGEELLGESAISNVRGRTIRRLRFVPDRPCVPDAVVESIGNADWVLIAPGSLFTSVIAVSALPNVCGAISRTSGRVVWIANLIRDAGETSTMPAADHLLALEQHGVRVDAILCDPEAEVSFAADDLARSPTDLVTGRLKAREPGTHDPVLLGAALAELFESRSPS